VKLVEVSFEVGNKVGGIHTVLASKARLMKELFSDYLLVGLYNPQKSPKEFEEGEVPEDIAQAAQVIEAMGGSVHYGRWLVPGKPNAVLIELGGLWDRLNDVKYKYWEWYKIDSLRSDNWFNEPILWSYAVGKFLTEYLKDRRDVVTIFHEWLSGGALLYLRKFAPHVPTIFHTHATMLGRVLANTGNDLYAMIDVTGACNVSSQSPQCYANACLSHAVNEAYHSPTSDIDCYERYNYVCKCPHPGCTKVHASLL
jgi:hypothetical protein